MTNLLANGGFDGAAWRKTHVGTEYNEIEVPEAWTCFWKEGGTVPHDPENEQGYRRPECKVIEPQPPYLDPPRVRNGAGAWQVFTLWGIHDAGLYQRVAAPAGSTVRATAYTHAWSAQGDKVAEGSIQDDNFTQLVGIDPTGGTDPWAPSVIWGPAQHLYDTYGRVLSTDATVGSGGIVTVFLREVVKWRYKHCDGYWDDVTLEVVGSDGGDDDDDDGGTGGTVKLDEDTLTRIEAALNGIRDAVREVGGEIAERLAALVVPDDGHEDDEDDEPPTATLPCTAMGSKIGAHCIEAGSVPAMVRDVVSRGAHVAVVKAVDNWGTLAEIKQDSPDTITIGRVTHPLEGCPDVADPETSLMVLAERIMSYTFNKINCTPEAKGLIDYYEPVNEPDPAGVAGYARLGELMLYC
ncbi:MAG: hypothetical protein M0R06_20125, partial [Sphaerochaeta sp.]|nr:hypothetical protein [Sphaerochaeta sp.]